MKKESLTNIEKQLIIDYARTNPEVTEKKIAEVYNAPIEQVVSIIRLARRKLGDRFYKVKPASKKSVPLLVLERYKECDGYIEPITIARELKISSYRVNEAISGFIKQGYVFKKMRLTKNRLAYKYVTRPKIPYDKPDLENPKTFRDAFALMDS